MKKSLLALAVLGAFVGAASAQTNVTIYGIVDAAIQYDKVRGGDSTWSMTDGNGAVRDSNKNGSRLGFKGSENLGGGLSAIFVLENGFNVDDGSMRSDGIFSRQAFVGLQGNFGTVKLGRQYTPMFIALDTIDPFNTGFAGNIGYVFNHSGLRTNNTINYSYSAAGFSGQVAYTLGEQAGSNSADRQIGLGLGYENGPLNVQFAYHKTTENPSSLGDTKNALLGATYDLNVVKLHAAFQHEKSEIVGDEYKGRNWMLGVSAPVGAGKVMASYVRGNDRTVANEDVDQYGLGYVYNLSKRTDIYTSYARQNDKSAANEDVTLFNVGVQHRF